MQSLTGAGDVEIQWGERSGGLQMGGVVETLRFLWWKRQVLSVFIRNNGPDAQSFLEANLAFDYRVALTHPDGRVEVMRRPEGEGDGLRNYLVELAAGDTHESRIPLSDWFDLGRPGEYKVKIERSFAGREPVSTPEIAFHV